MHLPDGPQLDLSEQVAKVKAKTRPWKAIIALILAICAAAASGWAHNHFVHFLDSAGIPCRSWPSGSRWRSARSPAWPPSISPARPRTVLDPSAGASHAAVVRYALLLIGAVTTLIITLGLLGIPIGQLVLGGALTSVFVGIAAQQSLSNVFAGIVLMLAHPFRIGDGIRLRAGALGGQVNGTILEVGITYVRISSSSGMLSIPNSQVLNASSARSPRATIRPRPRRRPPRPGPLPCQRPPSPPAVRTAPRPGPSARWTAQAALPAPGTSGQQ